MELDAPLLPNGADDPAAKIPEIEARLNRLRSPFRTAEAFWVNEIIDLRDRRRLCPERLKMRIAASL